MRDYRDSELEEVCFDDVEEEGSEEELKSWYVRGGDRWALKISECKVDG